MNTINFSWKSHVWLRHKPSDTTVTVPQHMMKSLLEIVCLLLNDTKMRIYFYDRSHSITARATTSNVLELLQEYDIAIEYKTSDTTWSKLDYAELQ